MNVNETNERVFQQAAEWKCQRSRCAVPATYVIE